MMHAAEQRFLRHWHSLDAYTITRELLHKTAVHVRHPPKDTEGNQSVRRTFGLGADVSSNTRMEFRYAAGNPRPATSSGQAARNADMPHSSWFVTWTSSQLGAMDLPVYSQITDVSPVDYVSKGPASLVAMKMTKVISDRPTNWSKTTLSRKPSWLI